MKKLTARIKKRPGLFLVLACYLVAVLALLLVQFGGFVANRILYATGALAPAELTIEDFELLELEPADNTLWTYGGDPQMVLKDAARRVENLVIEFEYAREPRSRNVFWAKPGQGYSTRRMAYSHAGRGQVFYLAPTGVQGLRLDPDTVPSNLITVKRIAINQPRPFWTFFIPGANTLVLLCVAPGLFASVLSIGRQALGGAKPRRARKAGEAG